MLFWNFLAFSMIQQMLAIWSLIPLTVLNPAWTSGISWFKYCWSLAGEFWALFCWLDECNCEVVWTFFGISFLWDWNENWPFLVLWPLLSFPNLLAHWVQHFKQHHHLGFEKARIPSPPLALFVVMLPQAHLALHSRMSGSRWVITPLWLFGSWRSFWYSSSVYSCHLF